MPGNAGSGRGHDASQQLAELGPVAR